MKINMRDYYPFFHHDYFVDVSAEVANQFKEWERNEKNYCQRKRRYHAFYSLDRGDGIEANLKKPVIMPNEIYENKELNQKLMEMLHSLPHKQFERIYDHIINKKSIKDIAKTEGVSQAAVRASITRGLNKLLIWCKEISFFTFLFLLFLKQYI